MGFTPKPKYQGQKAPADATKVGGAPGPKLTSKGAQSLGSSIMGGLKKYGKDLAKQARGEGRSKYGIK
jgi:hypothetical protein